MATYLLIVYTRPRVGCEAEFHRWYDETHLAEVLGVPGFTDARRMAAVPCPLSPAARPGDYAAAYTIQTTDIDRTIAEFDRARATMSTSDGLDPDSVSFQLLEVLPSPEPPTTGRHVAHH